MLAATRIVRPNVVRAVRKYWIELILGLVIVGISFYALLSGSYNVVEKGLTYPSLISYLSCFTLTLFFLHRQKLKFFDRILYSLISMLAGIVLFEIIYYYSFGLSQSELLRDFTFFGNGEGEGFFPLIWDLLITATLVLARRYMSMNKSLIAAVMFSVIVMVVWIKSCYSQVIALGSSTQFYPKVFDGIAKTIALIPAFLFNKKVEA